MNKGTADFRKKVADRFLKALGEKQQQWEKGWHAGGRAPRNAVTGLRYRGINRLYFTLLCGEWGIKDGRFATFHQIKEQGWHLKKGSKGVRAEYWMPYDRARKKVLAWEEYRKASLMEKRGMALLPKYFTVFSAKDIEGIPKLPEAEKHDIQPDSIIGKISRSMGVEIKNDGGDRAFYRPSEDAIHLPAQEFFDSDYSYNSVALHELSHATGAVHRLGRPMHNGFASQAYAYEELVAEISAAFMSENLSSVCDGYRMENHKAYVQAWAEALEKEPDILMKAVKDAERAADYLEYKADLVTEQEYRRLNAGRAELEPENTGTETRSYSEIRKDVRQAGFSPADRIVAGIEKLDRLSGKENKLKDICKAYRNGCTGLSGEERELVQAIAEECRAQELVRMAPVQ